MKAFEEGAAEPALIETRRSARKLQAVAYRARALAATASAEASELDHVRAKHEAAASRWLELAALSELENQGAPADTLAAPANPPTAP
jgi:hypothetical protein